MIKSREMPGRIDRETEMELQRLEKMVGINKIRLNLKKNRLICPLWGMNLKESAIK